MTRRQKIEPSRYLTRRRLLGTALGSGLGLVLLACGQLSEPRSATSSSPSTAPVANATPADHAVPVTIEDVYRRAGQALSRPGLIYHARVERHASTEGTLDPNGLGDSTTEIWVDGNLGVARSEERRAQDASTTIVTGAGQYTLGLPNGDISRADPPRCGGASLPVAFTLGCPDAPFETILFSTPGNGLTYATATPSVTIAPDQSLGRPALVLVAHREQQPYRSGPVSETRRLYLDPASCLPLAQDIERRSGGSVTRERATWSAEFIPSNLPVGFFDPLTLRSLRPDPQRTLDQAPPGFTLYWPGARLEGAAGVPSLELWHTDRYQPADNPQSEDQFTLDYTRSDDPLGGQPFIRLTERTRAFWDSGPSGRIDPDGPCWTPQELTLPAGRATLFLGYTWPENVPPPPGSCPTDRPHDRFLAHVFLGDTVVVVEPWAWPEQSREGLEALVRALGPRVRGAG